MAPAPMPSLSPPQDLEPILALRDASKLVVEGVNHTYPAFRNLFCRGSLSIGIR